MTIKGTYREEFPIGSRVRVHAPNRRDGSDNDHHGRAGTVVSHGMWFGVQMNLLRKGWTNPVAICPQYLRHERADT